MANDAPRAHTPHTSFTTPLSRAKSSNGRKQGSRLTVLAWKLYWRKRKSRVYSLLTSYCRMNAAQRATAPPDPHARHAAQPAARAHKASKKQTDRYRARTAFTRVAKRAHAPPYTPAHPRRLTRARLGRRPVPLYCSNALLWISTARRRRKYDMSSCAPAAASDGRRWQVAGGR